ncbi:putative mitochondrial inner membrane protease subunit Imp2 [Talaromyces proteolyticus]|uniref:Mitochondrial inner membrane protease subunit Imp2 n=1 Tax=Talaromyces proteolyticus TaxID=1131652 RepID=A0AAD4PYN5_9EURO|nr:putative mitochondrial inner membrane protease subunit Imp2 [Talaromyces proteolyticus]KAH8694992.1 putative mitochondrial inner membrane protease subunit Imp2 [Talaromyces proteolyticus]
MANFKAKPPPPSSDSKPGSATAQMAPKPRVISPLELRRRFAPRKPPSVTSSIPADFQTPLDTAYTKRPSAFSSFLSRFRARYAALPAPVRGASRFLRYLAPLVPIGLFFSEHVLQVMWVRGPSMTPYLNENYAEMQTESDMILVNMWPWGSGRARRLERGMVVTFRSPANSSNIAIKRVIALPGDRVTTREPCPRPSQIVPFNHVWLEGDVDDPRKSLDSNTYGPVSISLITGRVIAVLSPRMRFLKWQDWDKPIEEKENDNAQKTPEEGYRSSVRNRVVKEAVKIEAPLFN